MFPLLRNLNQILDTNNQELLTLQEGWATTLANLADLGAGLKQAQQDLVNLDSDVDSLQNTLGQMSQIVLADLKKTEHMFDGINQLS